MAVTDREKKTRAFRTGQNQPFYQNPLYPPVYEFGDVVFLPVQYRAYEPAVKLFHHEYGPFDHLATRATGMNDQNDTISIRAYYGCLGSLENSGCIDEDIIVGLRELTNQLCHPLRVEERNGNIDVCRHACRNEVDSVYVVYERLELRFPF